MLKIKDNVDLKELEKYGFELTNEGKYYSIIYTYYPLGDSQPSERNYLSVNIETRKIFNHIWGIKQEKYLIIFGVLLGKVETTIIVLNLVKYYTT